MDNISIDLHNVLLEQKRFAYPFIAYRKEFPKNGIYVNFEKGKSFNGLDRIVRIGTHNGNNKLWTRLKQHFIRENKDRSIFRKNIGRCILNTMNKHYLPIWELDNTTKEGKRLNIHRIDAEFENKLEAQISDYIQKNITFCLLRCDEMEERRFWERKLIATLAQNQLFKPSENWLGLQSTDARIVASGLWQVQHLGAKPLTLEEFINFKKRLIQK